jgi:large subunit ribosomal protein L17
MRHLVNKTKLNRNSSHRRAMIKNMVFSLITNEQIITTLPKAKFIKPFVEKIITIGKKYILEKNEERKLFLRRFLISKFNRPNKAFIDKILDTLSNRYQERNGGYVRIIKYYIRSDSTQMAVIELVDRDENEKGSSKYYN